MKQQTNFCNICGTELMYPIKCKLCGKKVCYKCRIQYYFTECNKCLEIYCIECWELGTPYRAEIEQLIIEHDNKVIKLEKEWANKVKQNLT